MNEEVKQKLIKDKLCEVCKKKATDIFFHKGFAIYLCKEHLDKARELK